MFTSLHRCAASVFLVVLCLSILPLTYAFSEEGGDEGGGDSPPPSEQTAPAPASTSEGTSENGGRRGHEMLRLMTIALFSAEHLYPSVLIENKTSDTLTRDEVAYLCSMSRIHLYARQSLPKAFVNALAALIHRPIELVKQIMDDPSGC